MKRTPNYLAADRRELRLAKRRRRFVHVEESIPLYERPCGCPNGNYIPNGVFSYHYASFGSTDRDLTECRQCGAVWTRADIEPTLDRFRREIDLALEAHVLGYRLVPRAAPFELKASRCLDSDCEECGPSEDACGGFGDFVSDRYTYEHGEKWAPSRLGSHDVPLPPCPACRGTTIVEAPACETETCSGYHPCETCKGTGTKYDLVQKNDDQPLPS